MTFLVNHLRDKARRMPDKNAFIHLTAQNQDKKEISFEQLDRKASEVACFLQKKGLANHPVILLLKTHIDFIIAFYGCIYAGAVAVPVPIPHHGKSWERVNGVAQNCGAKAIIATQITLNRMKMEETLKLQFKSDCQWLALEDAKKGDSSLWRVPAIDSEKLAFLQYTSGSTGVPKGVMISHGNLVENVQDLSKHFGLSMESVSISWLPMFHDMGLVAHVILPAVMGCHTILMDPLAFIRRPYLWLEAISQYKGTFSGAPNFAYELCVQRIRQNELDSLDLSCWKTAYSGAEPVRASTLKRFCERFSNNGFNPGAIYPVYGMSEATLMVSGKPSGESYTVLNSIETDPKDALSAGHLTVAKDLVSCGCPIGSQKLLIVDPVTYRPMGENQIGEIWIRGKNIAKGYWNQPEETNTYFNAHHILDDKHPFLKTGDLGLIRNNQLYIVGRIKDIVIINGENFSAEDMEYALALSHPVLTMGCCGIFSVDCLEGEKIVAACEVPKQTGHNIREEIVSEMYKTISREYGISLFDVILTPPHKLTRTTSGKLQRHKCRQLYLDGTLGKTEYQVYHPGLLKHRMENRLCQKSI